MNHQFKSNTRKQFMRRIWQQKNRLFLTVLFLILLSVALMLWNREDVYDKLEYVDGRFLNRDLLTLPVNQWVEIYPRHPKKSVFPNLFSGINWHRQSHAGMTFTGNRGTLLIFGSDSHGENWDNTVHEFSPLTLEWIDHYTASPKETYRTDKRGVAIAGENDLFPWAMHTYDSISYVPELGSLVVTSQTDHTPAPTELAKYARINPTWLYDLESKKWNILMQENGPSFFASGSSYDSLTASLWSYRQNQLWLLDAKSRQWKIIPGNHNTDLSMHFTMVTDTKRHQFVFFGNYNKSNSLWVYTPSISPGQEGRWENKQPGGDICPKAKHFPVAYDSHQSVFLLVPDETTEKSVTLVYTPDTNKYIKIIGADMPANGMNYMMEYDPYHRLFYLVTGDWRKPLTVWALHLDMQQVARLERDGIRDHHREIAQARFFEVLGDNR